MGFLDRLRGRGGVRGRSSDDRRGAGSSPPSSQGGGSGARGDPAPAPIRLRSLALASLFSQLVPGGAYDFLDLGPAIGGNVEFLSRYARTVRVGDLYATLNAETPRSIEAALESLTPERAYHGILAWDLLNYLDRDELFTAAGVLSRALAPGGFLLAVIHYTAQMPAEPLRLRIGDQETVTYREPRTTRPAPRYPQRTLLQAFGALEIERSYLLKAGLQEYLFTRAER